MKRPLFRDQALQSRYEQYGYVTLHAFDNDAELLRELNDGYNRLPLEDVYRIGYVVSLYSRDIATRRRAQDLLLAAYPSLGRFLVARRPYMATYLVKEASGRAIPPHQDWSHCDETRDDSAMCWIPLSDADEKNGGLGFIDGSHKYFDYLRAFPYGVAETPVSRYANDLLPYLNICRMKAGEAVVFNNRIIHGSLANHGHEPRLALSFALHPEDEPLLCYYLKPNGRMDTLLKYRVSGDFYLEHTQPSFLELYNRGETLPDGHQPEEVEYRLPKLDWTTLEQLVLASGNRRERWKEARVRESAVARPA